MLYELADLIKSEMFITQYDDGFIFSDYEKQGNVYLKVPVTVYF